MLWEGNAMNGIIQKLNYGIMGIVRLGTVGPGFMAYFVCTYDKAVEIVHDGLCRTLKPSGA
jgi:hypothetical protein